MSITGDAYAAALYGAVSASFMIEQLGPPTLTTASSSESGGGAGEELWNGDSPARRLAALGARMGVSSAT